MIVTMIVLLSLAATIAVAQTRGYWRHYNERGELRRIAGDE